MIFKREFRRNLKSLLIWSIIIGGLVALMLTIYPQFSKDKEALDAMVSNYPEGLAKAFGLDRIAFSTMIGFYAVEGYIMVALFGSVFASMLAANILSKEHNDKTIEFLLSKPITRSRILLEKIVLIVVNIFIFNLIQGSIVYFGFTMIDDETLQLSTFLWITGAPLLLHLMFAAISFFLSCVIERRKTISTTAIGIVFTAYFVNMIAAMSDKFESLKHFSPFKYVDAADIVINKQMDGVYLIVMIVIIILLPALSFFVYQKKDITV